MKHWMHFDIIFPWERLFPETLVLWKLIVEMLFAQTGLAEPKHHGNEVAYLHFQLRSKDGLAEPKRHGSEARMMLLLPHECQALALWRAPPAAVWGRRIYIICGYVCIYIYHIIGYIYICLYIHINPSSNQTWQAGKSSNEMEAWNGFSVAMFDYQRVTFCLMETTGKQ